MNPMLTELDLGGGLRALRVSVDDLEIDRTGILQVLGYHEGEMPEHFAFLLDQALSEAHLHCEPKAGYRLVEAGRIEGKPEQLLIGGVSFNTQKIVVSQMQGATQVAVFACSIGSKLETWARNLMHNEDPVLGFIADAVGSAVAEALADRLHDHIGYVMARQELGISNRYSPGYCNWSVAEQHALFSLLPSAFCGITLNESALMHPVKSVSGIIGVGATVKRNDYLCAVCRVPDCTYRRFHENQLEHSRHPFSPPGKAASAPGVPPPPSRPLHP
jgi:hypothetical protein